jgi:hypothetical protein
MERSKGAVKGLKVVATSIFLLAALLSTGCGQNALMNPMSSNSAQGEAVTINQGGQTSHPGGQVSHP